MMVGRELSAVFPKTAVEPGEVVLEVRGLGCRAAGVRDVDLAAFGPARSSGWPGWSARAGPSWRGSSSA